MPGTAEQKRQERAKRKERGEVRVEVWLSASSVRLLDELAQIRAESRSDAVSLALYYLAEAHGV